MSSVYSVVKVLVVGIRVSLSELLFRFSKAWNIGCFFACFAGKNDFAIHDFVKNLSLVVFPFKVFR